MLNIIWIAFFVSAFLMALYRALVIGDGGVWTPGALLGQALIDRLTANAGLTFQIEE